jgi:transcriptional regulator with XRE-family HTH domain
LPRGKKQVAVAIGKRMRAARESLGLLQEDVADKLGVSLESYGGYERGYTIIPTELLPELSSVLRRGVNYFLGIPDPTGLQPEEETVLSLFRGLRPHSKKMVTDLLVSLAQNAEETARAR